MRMTLITTLILLAATPLAYGEDAKPVPTPAPASAAKPDPNKPVAVVNGKEIPATYAELMKREMMAQGQPDDPQLDTRVRESLINMEVLSRAAIDKGLDKTPDVTAAIDIQRKNTYAKIYLDDYIKKHPVTDAEIQSEYDKAKAAAKGDEYHASHILVKTEAEAKKLIADLGKKVKFADLAKKYSLDPGSAKKGGDLNWSTSNAFVKEFSDALQSLKKGEITRTPVKTQFGYHIIKLNDTRPMKIPPLAEVKGEVLKQLQQKRIRDAITAARAAAKVE